MRVHRLAGMVLALCLSAVVCRSQSQQELLKVARSFVPTGAEVVELRKYDPSSGKLIEAHPAVLTGHILSPESRDLVFAYATPAGDSCQNALFISMLHQTKSGYRKLYELTYYNKQLWVQDFSTVGLRLVRPPKAGRDGVAIITGIGALMGARVEFFMWDNAWGLMNTVPDNGGAHGISLVEGRDSLAAVLSFARYPGDKEAQPPITYRWAGNKFIKSE